MTQAEKLRIIADAMEGKCKIELTLGGKWFGITFGGEKSFRFSEHWHDVYELLDLKISIAKTLPLLSDAGADFAEKYLPHDWWIARDSNSVEDENLYVYDEKPRKGRTYWVGGSNGLAINIMIPTFPKFESIKWEDEDCYTIQELLDYYRDHKGKQNDVAM